ncbi:hypothetical protein DH2020_021762 [Rehmannia glutinosa]|uniref:Inositol polyphosphate-related phosphatase domain-containing protein n=1 Tax=Rehmannia glutinosa TaxID=99300 RepID=A0ABR0WF68_REHGL
MEVVKGAICEWQEFIGINCRHQSVECAGDAEVLKEIHSFSLDTVVGSFVVISAAVLTKDGPGFGGWMVDEAGVIRLAWTGTRDPSLDSVVAVLLGIRHAQLKAFEQGVKNVRIGIDDEDMVSRLNSKQIEDWSPSTIAEDILLFLAPIFTVTRRSSPFAPIPTRIRPTAAGSSALTMPRRITKNPRIFDRFYNSSSSDDEEDDASSSSNYQRRLDYMLQFLDRKLSSSSSPDQPLPEFAASGGVGIFKPPVRGPVHPNRQNGFEEVFSWQAHRGPVLSMVVSSYDLALGTIEKSLSLTTGERHMASLLIERSYIDLRSQVSQNGACSNIFTSDVKYMLSDHSGAKVWAASYQSFSLCYLRIPLLPTAFYYSIAPLGFDFSPLHRDARTRELLKVFNIDGQIENMSLDSLTEDEMRMRFVSGSKEKAQNSFNFFQRSRNVILGAADAVRRAAAKGAFGDDNRQTEALVATVDGMIWIGCANGLLVQWDGNGNRLRDLQYHSSAVQSLCTFGSRIWVGYMSGTVQVLDLNGDLLGQWVAHSSPVIDLAVGAGYVFTLANHGGIRGWSITSPGPLDNIFRAELAGKEFLYTRLENLKILAGTWNVGEGRAAPDSLISWLGSAAADIDIIVVGLQEVEMGAGFLAVSAAKETMGLEGSSAGQWWLDMIGKMLNEGSTFSRVGSRQLAGLLISVWVRNNIRGHVGDVDVAAVPCGLGRAIGNKGAVGLRMRVYGRVMCFVNCHFAAHLEAVNRRNADFDHRVSHLQFKFFALQVYVPTWLDAAAMGVYPVEGMPELSEADMVVFLGDFNYRLDGISYDEARDFVSQRCFDWLRERDQLQAEMKAGNVFQGMREAIIKFPPTYKFEKHQPGLAGYDSGEKKRIPAWCDRILYRDSRSASASTCSLDCPVVASILQLDTFDRYEASMDVTDSDHKPVRCIFSVEVARVDESIRRQEFGEIIRSNEKIKRLLEELAKVPEAIVSTNNIILQNQDSSILRITNKCKKDRALYEISCEGLSTIKEDGQASDHRPRGSFGFPRWLEVNPAAGIVEADQIAEISIRHEKYETLEEFVDGVPQNFWCEDARDKEVILVVKLRGSCTMEAQCHRVRVRYSITGKLTPMNRRADNSDQVHANLLRRSDFHRISASYDVVDHLRNLHTP